MHNCTNSKVFSQSAEVKYLNTSINRQWSFKKLKMFLTVLCVSLFIVLGKKMHTYKQICHAVALKKCAILK